MKSRIKYLRLIRPHQYVKNGFVLVGVLFSHRWDAATLGAAGLAFVAFCAMASAGYIMNDIMDADADRQHPRKSRRPIANGSVKVRKALILYTALVAISFSLAILIGGLMPFLLLAYLLTNVAYSLWLKHVVILDVFLISAGFMWRLLAGTLGLGFEPSNWLLLCGFMLTLFLGFAKRRAELLMAESAGDASRARTRRVLGDYSPAMLEQYTAVTAACTIISYGLFTVSKGIMPGQGGEGNMIYTVPFVVYGIFRYVFLLHNRAQGSDAAQDLLTDRHLLVTVACWVGACFAVLMSA